MIGYDPWQAELMAARCSHQKVKMREVRFTGENLNLMASTLLDVFRSRQIDLYDDSRLIDDLGRLNIEERSYGHRLTATHNASGHADLATAFAIALPIAVKELARVPLTVSVGINAEPWGESRTPYDRYRDENDGESNINPHSLRYATEIQMREVNWQ